ncbi:MAG: hypothetical protein FJZ00_01680 [Candidatus Sericytochromatia bacterium]|uniref:Uncharacterized protein n=1 Tax=Candidatus Tanganyikabacteria bacterium TaxID=2961651 RepID=A0A937X0Q9_9BACT|nr:hypothetical protein [Candidatus Tanganyikabacteria bacterium]
MKTIHDALVALASRGWRQKATIGRTRILEHPDKPGVYIYLRGRPSSKLTGDHRAEIRRKANV